MSEQFANLAEDVESIEKSTGRAKFVSDMILPGMLHGKILRSPHAHAKIVHIETADAIALPGVKAVITGKDVEKLSKPYGPVIHDEMALHPNKVRYVGDEVAAVAAISEEIAEKALALIQVEYEILPAVFEVTEAIKPDAPKIHEKVEKNTVKKVRINVGDATTALAKVDLVVKKDFITSRVTATPAEPHVAIASFDPYTQHLTLWSSTQAVFHARHAISSSFGIPENRVRVISPEVGGGFGHKVDGIYSNDVCAIILSLKTGRPVKILLNREEETTATRTRHLTKRSLEIGLTKDGRMVALREKSWPILGHIAVLAQGFHG